ncbi:BMP family protein [Jatrophihabitans endophyticus]|uniref:BMP family lipoprotein n=1 Tax=Jatrophihabitans endophyticus TaxID=1206085 RepID=UPI001A01EE46|nr:BMP family ABC transporter substrate-binding protein [Jatrophihabitans endophyticus]MBE7188113.1 BMP family ABC transporter substrate-binding protein [Jatrophihabitans endophyticus]
MRHTRWTVAVTGIAAIALTLSACGSKASPSANTGGGGSGGSGGAGSSTASTASYKACMVTDTGGINDKSFNQSAYQGLTEAQGAGAATVSYLPSTQTSDYAKNISAEQGQGCKMIVTVGYLMADATDAAAKAAPSQHFAIVDNTGNGKNVEGLLFNTAQAGFEGGYLAAGYSKTGKVATYGGEDFATVTVYMDGFWEGVQYYNKMHHKNVQVLGWNEKTQKGSFAGSFTDQTKGSQLAKNFMQAGADVIYPVAGGTGLGTAAAVKAANNGTVVIWVDTDGCISAKQYCSVFLTTTYKGIQPAVKTAVENGAKGKYTGTNYVGTLANGGTGLSPYHDFASKVSSTLKSEVAQVGKDIESGKIKIQSKNQPK